MFRLRIWGCRCEVSYRVFCRALIRVYSFGVLHERSSPRVRTEDSGFWIVAGRAQAPFLSLCCAYMLACSIWAFK